MLQKKIQPDFVEPHVFRRGSGFLVHRVKGDDTTFQRALEK